MTRYVFDKPEQMFDWIDKTAYKLLSIPRQDFGKIKIEIERVKNDGCNYPWEISEHDRKQWEKKFEKK